MPFLELQCFGIFQVRLAGKPYASFGTEKVRALLAYLAVEKNQPSTRQYLTGLLWPDQPEKQAQHNFRQALSTLRKLLQDDGREEPFILIFGDNLQFNHKADQWVDVHLFQEQIEKGFTHLRNRKMNGRPNIPVLRAGISLFQDIFLAQFNLDNSNAFDEWLFMQREIYNQQAIRALATLAEYHERREEFGLARRYAEQLSGLAPWDESAHLQVIRLLALDGEWNLAQARYQTFQSYFIKQIAMEPTAEARAVFEQIRSCAAEKQKFVSAYPRALHNIPRSGSPFFGRHNEIISLADSLSDPEKRLITLLGVGGIGKSRLAVEMAYMFIGLFSDGVWFVPLNEKRLYFSIAESLKFNLDGDLEPKAQIIKYLHQKKLLLIFDSFEHVQDEIENLSEMLNAAPGLVILVTSRQRLNLSQELIYQLDGLELPPADIKGELQAELYSSAALFLSRYRRLHRNLILQNEDFPALARICHLLNGLPLGLELAAAATWSMPLPVIAERISHNLDFLESDCPDIPVRHRSLRAAFDYSWEMLNQEQKEVFTQLAIFSSSFTIPAAVTILGCRVRVITDLLDRSLLRLRNDSRLEIPESIVPYSTENLIISREDKQYYRQQHAQYYTTFFESMAYKLNGKEVLATIKTLLPELGNARQAWCWAVENGEREVLARLLNPLHKLLHTRSVFHESIALLEMISLLPISSPVEENLISRVKVRLGMDYLQTGQPIKAEEELNDGLAVLNKTQDSEDLILGLDTLATLFQKQAKQEQARQLATQALQLSEEYDDKLGQKNALFLLADIEFRRGDLKAAEAMMRHCLEVARQTGNPMALLAPLNSLGDYACYEEDYHVAVNNFEECLQIAHELGSGYHEAIQLNNLGTVHHMLENYDQAIRYYEESLSTCRLIGDQEGEAVVINNLGEIMVIKEELNQAVNFFERSLVIARQIKNPRTMAISLNNLGETFRKMQNPTKAWQFFFNGLRTAQDSQIIAQVLEALTGLGILLLNSTDAPLGATTLQIVVNHGSTEPDDRIRASNYLENCGIQPDTSISLNDLVQEIINKTDHKTHL